MMADRIATIMTNIANCPISNPKTLAVLSPVI
jgi:hypothetical protein